MRGSAIRWVFVLLLMNGRGTLPVSANLATNESFEESRVVPPTEWVHKTMREREWKLDDPIAVPVGWNINPIFDNGEFRLVKSAAEVHSGNQCVYLKGDLSNGSFPVAEGDEVTISFWARAPREPRVNGLLYSYGKDETGKPVGMGDWIRFEAIVGKEWKQFSGTLSIPPELGGYPVTSVVPVLRSRAGAYFDDVEVTIDTSRRKTAAQSSAPTEGRVDVADSINGNFEGWAPLESTPPGWELAEGRVPWRWAIEDIPGQARVLRRALNPIADQNEFGLYALYLTGRLLSTRTLTNLTNKTVQISLWARGKGGSFIARLREYSDPTYQQVGVLADVIEEETGDEWKEYSATVTMMGGMSYARLELVGEGVLIDRVKVTPIETDATAKAQLPQMWMTIPLVPTRPTVDGKFRPRSGARRWVSATASCTSAHAPQCGGRPSATLPPTELPCSSAHASPGVPMGSRTPSPNGTAMCGRMNRWRYSSTRPPACSAPPSLTRLSSMPRLRSSTRPTRRPSGGWNPDGTAPESRSPKERETDSGRWR